MVLSNQWASTVGTHIYMCMCIWFSAPDTWVTVYSTGERERERETRREGWHTRGVVQGLHFIILLLKVVVVVVGVVGASPHHSIFKLELGVVAHMRGRGDLSCM